MKNKLFTPFFADRYILGIEFGEGIIKVIVLKKIKDEYRIVDLELFNGQKSEIEEKLSNFLKTKPYKYSKTIISLNRYFVSSRYVRLPSSDNREIEEMIPFQIRRLFPYTTDDVVFSFDILDTNTEGFSNVILFVAQKDRVKNILNLLSGLKIKPDILSMSSLGIKNWYLTNNKNINNETTAIVDTNPGYLELCVVYNTDKVAYSRTIMLDSSVKISEEIKKCLEAYAKEPNLGSITKLILIGSEEKYKNLADEFSKNLKIKAEVINPCQYLAEKYPQLNCASVMGLLLDDKPVYINLLPEEEKNVVKNKAKNKQKQKTVILSLALVLSLSLNFIFYIKKRFASLQSIDKKLSISNPEIEKLADMQKKLLFVKKQFEQRYLPIQILNELYTITPEGIFLNIFIYEKGNQVVIKGSAVEMSLVFEYVSILEKSPFLKNAEVRFATKRNVKGQEFTDFEIFSVLEGL